MLQQHRPTALITQLLPAHIFRPPSPALPLHPAVPKPSCARPPRPCTVAFAVSMARRRKAEEIEASDLQLYLKNTWWVLSAEAATTLGGALLPVPC